MHSSQVRMKWTFETGVQGVNNLSNQSDKITLEDDGFKFIWYSTVE